MTDKNATSLDGKVAIVTGSARNIGRATALALAADGAAIVVNAVHDQDAAEIGPVHSQNAKKKTRPGWAGKPRHCRGRPGDAHDAALFVFADLKRDQAVQRG